MNTCREEENIAQLELKIPKYNHTWMILSFPTPTSVISLFRRVQGYIFGSILCITLSKKLFIVSYIDGSEIALSQKRSECECEYECGCEYELACLSLKDRRFLFCLFVFSFRFSHLASDFPIIHLHTCERTLPKRTEIDLGTVHTKIDLSWIDLRSISVRFEKVFTLI